MLGKGNVDHRGLRETRIEIRQLDGLRSCCVDRHAIAETVTGSPIPRPLRKRWNGLDTDHSTRFTNSRRKLGQQGARAAPDLRDGLTGANAAALDRHGH